MTASDEAERGEADGEAILLHYRHYSSEKWEFHFVLIYSPVPFIYGHLRINLCIHTRCVDPADPRRR